MRPVWGWMGSLGPRLASGLWLVQGKTRGVFFWLWSTTSVANAKRLLAGSKSAVRVLSPPDRDGVRHVAITKRTMLPRKTRR